MSAAKASTAEFADAERMSAAACSARTRSRPVMPTRAPMAAGPMAVALPIPPVPPVIRTTLPAIERVRAMVRASNPLVGCRLETLEEEPEWQHQLKEETGDREIEADVEPEDFGDRPRNENRVADQARKRQPPRDQLGPEQQQAQEYRPDSERHLAHLVGGGVRLDQNCRESLRPGLTGVPGQGNDQEESEHPDGQQNDLNNHRRQVGQRGSLAVLLEDREEQNTLSDIHPGVQQHQESSNDQDGLTRENRREKVGPADQGSHKAGAHSVKEKAEQKQRPNNPRIRHPRPRHFTGFGFRHNRSVRLCRHTPISRPFRIDHDLPSLGRMRSLGVAVFTPITSRYPTIQISAMADTMLT